jgi:hypothetical protein
MLRGRTLDDTTIYEAVQDFLPENIKILTLKDICSCQTDVTEMALNRWRCAWLTSDRVKRRRTANVVIKAEEVEKKVAKDKKKMAAKNTNEINKAKKRVLGGGK